MFSTRPRLIGLALAVAALGFGIATPASAQPDPAPAVRSQSHAAENSPRPGASYALEVKQPAPVFLAVLDKPAHGGYPGAVVLYRERLAPAPGQGFTPAVTHFSRYPGYRT